MRPFSDFGSIYAPHTLLVDTCGGVFQIRPHKDFLPRKGRERILSLHLLSTLPTDEVDPLAASSSSSDTEPRSAYDFMRRQRDVNGDPTTQRWNASIRLANYAAVDDAPLCVSECSYLRVC